MTLLRFPRHFFAAMMFLPLSGLILGCGGDKPKTETVNSSVSITGKVSFVRPSLLTNANGIPTGLETDPTKFVTLPAPGVSVRFLRASEETLPDGSKVVRWTTTGGTDYQGTTSEGNYFLQVPKGEKIFVEVLSIIKPPGDPIRIIAEAAGIHSSIPEADRVIYSMRKGLDGTSGTNTPGTTAINDAVVNFEIGLNDKWWIGQEHPSKAADAQLETTGTGSRIPAMAHSIMKFSTAYGLPTPGAPLDLHYRRGVSEQRGTYVEYDQDQFPLSYNASSGTRHFFGSVGGSALNDDAFDESVLLQLFSRNFLVSTKTTDLRPLSTQNNHLSPGLAVLEGFPPAMAATVLKSPYLADTTASGISVRDIRDLSALGNSEKNIFSPAVLSNLAWELGLKAASLPTPGTVTDWAKIEPFTTRRFFIPSVSTDSNSHPTDIVSIYSQLLRLKETKAAAETVDLAAIFTDPVLTGMLTPLNITWPRPTTGPLTAFLLDWGKDPNTRLAPIPIMALSMRNATELSGLFPNVSHEEVFYSKFTLSKDTSINLNAVSTPPLPAGSRIEIVIDGSNSYLFEGSAVPIRITLRGNATTPVFHSARTRVLSPTNRIVDTQILIKFDPI